MADFRPFRGWRYNPQVVGNLAAAICPPYDLITKETQETLHDLSPYNAVRLEAGHRLDWDEPTYNRYQQAATYFREWMEGGVLRRDQEPGFYLLRYDFTYQGQRLTQTGIIGGVRLEDYSRRIVLPHEFTWEPAIRDRVALMEACRANFSPIMSLYRDSQGALTPVLEEVMTGQPSLQTRDEAGQEFTLWQIADPDLTRRIHRFFADLPVFLADGHHRYEAALKYQQVSRQQAERDVNRDAAYNFVMMALIEFENAGLLLLPYHRVVGGLSSRKSGELQKQLNRYFEALPLETGSDVSAEGLLARVAQAGRKHLAMGLIGANGDGPQLLTLREGVDWRQWGPQAASEAWILEEQVIKPVLGEATFQHVSYVHDHQQALERVKQGEQQMAFLLKPFPMSQFESIVGQGQRLPPKSTFFYPKLPTGLVINQLEGLL